MLLTYKKFKELNESFSYPIGLSSKNALRGVVGSLTQELEEDEFTDSTGFSELEEAKKTAKKKMKKKMDAGDELVKPATAKDADIDADDDSDDEEIEAGDEVEVDDDSEVDDESDDETGDGDEVEGDDDDSEFDDDSDDGEFMCKRCSNKMKKSMKKSMKKKMNKKMKKESVDVYDNDAAVKAWEASVNKLVDEDFIVAPRDGNEDLVDSDDNVGPGQLGYAPIPRIGW